MSWSDRQRAMLKEMGLSVAWPGLDAPDAPALGAPREGHAAPSSPPPAQARHDPAVGAQRAHVQLVRPADAVDLLR